jgi:hypothetical protein
MVLKVQNNWEIHPQGHLGSLEQPKLIQTYLHVSIWSSNGF